jgi:hypothetical protein
MSAKTPALKSPDRTPTPSMSQAMELDRCTTKRKKRPNRIDE